MSLAGLRKLAEAVLADLGKSGWNLDVFLVPDRLIQRLNRDFRRHDRPTTVLSFPPAPGPRSEKLPPALGEIYLAPAYIKSHNEKVGRLLVHGLLHLVGFDHRTGKEETEMEREEKRLEEKFSGRREFRQFFK
jgi:rRNA maturation RNase YbeY